MSTIGALTTLDELAQEVTEAYGSSSTTDKAIAYRAINRAVKILARKGRWPFFRLEDQLLTTVSGTATYTLQSTVKRVDFIHLRNPTRKLKMVDLRTLRIAYPNDTSITGTPLFWREVNYDGNADGYKITLFPTPDSALSLYYDCDTYPQDLVDKSDDIRSTGIPDEMIDTVIQIAVALMYEKYDNDMYNQKMAEAKTQLDDDFYRMTQHADDDLRARVHGGAYDIRRDDPVLDPRYGD